MSEHISLLLPNDKGKQPRNKGAGLQVKSISLDLLLSLLLNAFCGSDSNEWLFRVTVSFPVVDVVDNKFLAMLRHDGPLEFVENSCQPPVTLDDILSCILSCKQMPGIAGSHCPLRQVDTTARIVEPLVDVGVLEDWAGVKPCTEVEPACDSDLIVLLLHAVLYIEYKGD